MVNFAAGSLFLRRWLARKPRSAERLAASPKAALRLLDLAMKRAGSVGSLRDILTDVLTMGRLVKAWVKRDYRAVSRGTVLLVMGAIAYFVAPIDAILDAIPFAGFIDDAAVLAFVLREVRGELSAFRTWEVNPASAAAPALEAPATPPQLSSAEPS